MAVGENVDGVVVGGSDGTTVELGVHLETRAWSIGGTLGVPEHRRRRFDCRSDAVSWEPSGRLPVKRESRRTALRSFYSATDAAGRVFGVIAVALAGGRRPPQEGEDRHGEMRIPCAKPDDSPGKHGGHSPIDMPTYRGDRLTVPADFVFRACFANQRPEPFDPQIYLHLPNLPATGRCIPGVRRNLPEAPMSLRVWRQMIRRLSIGRKVITKATLDRGCPTVFKRAGRPRTSTFRSI